MEKLDFSCRKDALVDVNLVTAIWEKRLGYILDQVITEYFEDMVVYTPYVGNNYIYLTSSQLAVINRRIGKYNGLKYITNSPVGLYILIAEQRIPNLEIIEDDLVVVPVGEVSVDVIIPNTKTTGGVTDTYLPSSFDAQWYKEFQLRLDMSTYFSLSSITSGLEEIADQIPRLGLAMEVAELWETDVLYSSPLILDPKVEFSLPPQLWFETAFNDIERGLLPAYRCNSQMIDKPKDPSEAYLVLKYAAKRAYEDLVQEEPLLKPMLIGVQLHPDTTITARFDSYQRYQRYLELLKTYQGYYASRVVDDVNDVSTYLAMYAAYHPVTTFIEGKNWITIDQPVFPSTPIASTSTTSFDDVKVATDKGLLNYSGIWCQLYKKYTGNHSIMNDCD